MGKKKQKNKKYNIEIILDTLNCWNMLESSVLVKQNLIYQAN